MFDRFIDWVKGLFKPHTVLDLPAFNIPMPAHAIKWEEREVAAARANYAKFRTAMLVSSIDLGTHGEVTPQSFITLLAQAAEPIPVTAILVNAQTWERIAENPAFVDYVDTVTRLAVIREGFVGWIWGIGIYTDAHEPLARRWVRDSIGGYFMTDVKR